MTRLLLVFLLGVVGTSNGAHILGIFPTPSISHQSTFQTIMKTLAARGHQVIVISPDPLKFPVENYTDIDLSKSYEFLAKWELHKLANLDPIDTLSLFNGYYIEILDYQLGSPEVQSFIRSKDTAIDLVVIEPQMFHVYHGLIHHIGSPPVVGVLTVGATTFALDAMANPNNPGFCPDVLTSYSDHMTFGQRIYNLYAIMKMRYVWHYEVLPGQEVLLRKYFGSAPPSVYESNYNMSLLLLNNHWSLNYPRPLLPNIVELTGLHIQTTSNPLPKDVKSFLDGGKHGVIYFSLGSNVKSKDFSEEKVKEILEAFSELSQRVLWKFEAESLKELPDNVKVGKWFPQQDILAHPNVRVFITQGGLQSFQEAAYHGVPLIGIPFIGDQFHNVAKFEAAKIGVRLLFKDLSRDTLLEALGKVLNDSSYGDNMKKFSASYREEVGPSLERAIWWIEYVMRHQGAPHLRSAAIDLTWYQYILLDVITLLLSGIITIVVITFIVLKTLISQIRKLIPVNKIKIN